MYFKASEDSFLGRCVSKNGFWSVLRGDYEFIEGKAYLSSFSLSRGMVAVSPYLQVVTQAGMVRVKVFQQNMALSFVSVPPLVSELLVGFRVIVSGIAALTHSGLSMYPYTFAISGFSCDSHVIFLDSLKA